MINFTVPTEQLSTLIREIAKQVLAEVQGNQYQLGNRLAYSESEAAELVSLARHQLRDERLRGRIKHSRGPKNTVLYSREDLLEYLASTRN